ncbi:FKBP-type peptidyl-prolyl cis-trans isomerase [Mucilaginibacter sp. SG564]|uniref:FKBP-type peptidyl-prolyl cis-trans isomerase n=1 Tax=unclassified Mucilaginibacter TaxID=2617802 RepID=UPI001551B00A|nr:FKBP-type peptidyl-prolyl cis-trans isomerase [Mucilaginibacter sp. SG564]NOW94505.1 FKBP-type peptidyl-prolyl cis-trans isomerase FkpA [Mucilaginibacter sp. SG564]
MKKYILLLSAFALIVLASSCGGSMSAQMAQQAKIDDSLIRVYLKANPQIKAVKDPSGLYYQIIKPGTGVAPTESSTVTVNYTCSLMGGQLYDKGSNFSSPLSGLVKAWQIAVPHLKPGGNMVLYVPSHLAYGVNGAGPIPENAVLTFDIDLVSVP